MLFSYLHLAAMPELAQALKEKGLTAVAFETVEADGNLPLLAPMSDIAGRLSVHIGTTLLHSHAGGRGILLGGLPSAERGRVVVLGAGVAGGNAASRGGRARRAGHGVRAHRDSWSACTRSGRTSRRCIPMHH